LRRQIAVNVDRRTEVDLALGARSEDELDVRAVDRHGPAIAEGRWVTLTITSHH
jgi:hypothetical protein